MQPLVWSQDRLKDPESIRTFVRIFGTRRGTEEERLRVVPLVFGLLPAEAINRRRPDLRVKPAIRRHLQELDVQAGEELVSILKAIADQFFETGTNRKQRVGIEGVRALREGVYDHILKRQGARCAVCGVRFVGGVRETLDHIIPWRLVGDVFDGSNWQILCDECNLGKREWLSVLQSAHVHNWMYAAPLDAATTVSPELRYLALALSPECSVRGCMVGPMVSRLEVRLRLAEGLAVLDNIAVLCAEHFGVDGRDLKLLGESPVSVMRTAGVSPTIAETPSVAVPTFVDRMGTYLLECRVTSGGMAECYLAVNEETGEQVFVKRVARGQRDEASMQREVEIYNKLDRRNAQHTLRVVDFLRSETHLALVFERAANDLTVFSSSRPCSQKEAKVILGEIVAGLEELHAASIVHRDLKPGNVLYCGERWVLSDFGISKDVNAASAGQTFQRFGTSGYAAPEQLLTGCEAAPAADVYSLGKIIVYLLTGDTDLDKILSPDWRRLVRDCTAEQPEQRPALPVVRDRIAQLP